MENLEVLKQLFNDSSPLIFKNGEQVQFYCPFCKHHKRKLSINVYTGYWHCWICGEAGISYKSLLRKLHANKSFYESLKVTYKVLNKHNINNNDVLSLPSNFKSLYKNKETTNPYYKNAVYYCKTRGLTEEDFIRYNIGYCETGEFGGRIIIPSYDLNNNLNFYCGRDFTGNNPMKYKLAQASKDIIGFENLTDFRFPITLVEGVFDAFGVKYNVIPLFGKSMSKKLKEKILIEKPPRVNVLLDNDAYEDAVKICEYLSSNFINCNIVKLDGKDPNEIGHKRTWECIQNSTTVNKKELILLKLKNKLNRF